MFLFQIHPTRYDAVLPEAYSAIALVLALTLIGLLLLKELSGFQEGGAWRRLDQTLNLAIAPLLAAFLVGVGLRIAEALR